MELSALSAAGRYAAARPVTEPTNGAGSPSQMAANLVRDFATTLQESEAISTAAMTGDADPHALVQALAQTELAVETAITVRDKVVEAYQEILRMPV